MNEFQVNTVTLGDQKNSIVTKLTDGSILVTWEKIDFWPREVHGQKYSSSGKAIGDEVVIYQTNSWSGYDIAALSDGGFIFATTASNGANKTAISVQHFNSDATPLSEAQFVTKSNDNVSGEISVTGLTNGRYAVSSLREHPNDDAKSAQFIQIFSANDRAEATANRITPFQDYTPYTNATIDIHVDITGLEGGGLVAAITYTTSTFTDLALTDVQRYGFVQTYTDAGVAIGPKTSFGPNTETIQWAPQIITLNDGKFLATWYQELDSFSGGSGGQKIAGQVYNSNGTKFGSPITFKSGSYALDGRDFTALPDGGFVYVYRGGDPYINGSEGDGIDAKRYNSEGKLVANWTFFTPVNDFLPGRQYDPSVTATADGGFFVSWTSEDQDGSGLGIFGKVLSEGAFYGASTNDTLSGSIGDNSIFGFEGNDTLKGKAGDDILDGGAGKDWLTGGRGKDTFVFSDLDSTDVITDFQWAIDKISISTSQNSPPAMQIHVPSKALLSLVKKDFVISYTNDPKVEPVKVTKLLDALKSFGKLMQGDVLQTSKVLMADDFGSIVKGSIKSESIFGSDKLNILSGKGGKDWIYGGNLYDEIDGGNGHDHLFGNSGDDLLRGKAGNDSLYGGDNYDILIGGRGNDLVDGGAGFDRMWGNGGRDVFVLSDNREHSGKTSVDHINDFYLGKDKIDLSNFFQSGHKIKLSDLRLILDPDDGARPRYHVMVVDPENSSELIDMAIIHFPGGHATSLNPDPSDFLIAKHFILSKGPGGDLGSPNSDKMVGTNRDDAFYGLQSSDTLIGRKGNDILDGGGGRDILNGGAGKDILFGGKGNDKVHGNAGHGVLNGNAGKDKLFGDKGNDTLIGGNGNDRLNGGKGDDFLAGGAGRDLLTGGKGEDVFHFNLTHRDKRTDIVTDFELGTDKISIDGYRPDQITYKLKDSVIRLFTQDDKKNAFAELDLTDGFDALLTGDLLF